MGLTAAGLAVLSRELVANEGVPLEPNVCDVDGRNGGVVCWGGLADRPFRAGVLFDPVTDWELINKLLVDWAAGAGLPKPVEEDGALFGNEGLNPEPVVVPRLFGSARSDGRMIGGSFFCDSEF